LAKNEYTILAMEFRSFAGTPGELTQYNLFQDAAQAYDLLKNEGYKTIVVYGYSFGTAFASGLTSLREMDALILTSPFSSLETLVSEKTLPFAHYLLCDTYPSIQYILNFDKPLLIIHGEKDRLIPYHHAQWLYDAAKSRQKEIHILDNETHASVYFERKNLAYILDFLKRLEG
jgi:esterase/lipase